MPNYTLEGKIETPISDAEFEEGLKTGHFITKQHKAYAVLLYYSGVRKKEGLRAVREDFQITPDAIMFDVGDRLKHSKKTPALKIPLAALGASELKQAIERTPKGKRVFPYSDKTGYNIIRRVYKYPHWFRLSRITHFFLEGWTIAQIRTWTGLTLDALEYYIGLVDTQKMGESLAKAHSTVTD